ncbi:hypothetical protein [Geomonas edaphica]|uniref:hypothetical protein n=1 Tax=Geomonas edaphica TaxID=2570226 RepID=UPI0010A85391|nr:hypothetical protein [Geomonas edaphica]
MSKVGVTKLKSVEIVKLESAPSNPIIKLESVRSGRRKYLSLSEHKPLKEQSDDANKIVPFNMRRSEEYRKWVCDSGPYRLSITLTLAVRTGFETLCKHVNSFLRKANIKIFKPGYWKRDWLQGFAFFEDHPMENSINEMHVHMLIKPNARLNVFKLAELVDIFVKAAAAVVNADRRRVFFEEHMKVKYAYHNRHTYLFKQIDDTRLNRVKPIGVKGLSDSSLY